MRFRICIVVFFSGAIVSVVGSQVTAQQPAAYRLPAIEDAAVRSPSSVPATDELLQRLQRAEASIMTLQNENTRLQMQFDQGLRQIQDELESTEGLYPISAANPGEPLPSPDASSAKGEKKGDDPGSEKKKEGDKDKKKEDDKKDKEKKKKEWYEKLSIRGYAQFRYNYVTHLDDDSAPAQYAGDSSIGNDQEFLIRRARLILFGDVSEHLYLYLQPDFASTPDGSTNNIQFAQIRDWYGDVYLDTDKVNRLRIGQSKIPYGWENLQSSQNRLPLDRGDAFNSAARNERDLGVFYYWTPQWAQDTFKYIQDENLKGSGNYGVFGFGAYNGQGGSLRELNDELHLISRLTLPVTTSSGQIVEFGVQGYTGRYVVNGAAIAPLGVGPAVIPLNTRNRPVSDEGLLDQRLGWTFVYYPQPFGLFAEHTIGRGPELNAAQTEIIRGSLHGGQVMANYRYQTACHGEFWPFARWQYYQGGYKNAVNSPYSTIDEWSLGLEWQIRKEMELVCEYLITDRTNLQALSSGQSYRQFDGDVLRFQFQVNY